MPLTDVQLIRQARAGNVKALEALIRRYQGFVYGLAYHWVGQFADAEDIAQEVFITVYRHLDQLAQPECFTAWLKTITIHASQHWRRRQHPTLALDEIDEIPAAIARWQQHEETSAVQAAVAALSEQSRLVITLHYLSGLSHREIGTVLGTNANAVAQRLHRARRQLKAILLAEVRREYAMHQLPEDFSRQVLKRMTLFPVVEGQFVTVRGAGDTRGLLLGARERRPTTAMVTLWMQRDDVDAIAPIEPGGSAGAVKARTIAGMRAVLESLEVAITRVVLSLAGDTRCRATVELLQRGAPMTVALRPSDALCLAVQARAPIFVEEPVITQGNVGEDNVPVPEERISSAAWRAELQAQHELDQLLAQAFALGLAPAEQIDTVRVRVDAPAGTLRLWLEAQPEREATLALDAYPAGVKLLFTLAQQEGRSGILSDTQHYNISYALLGGDARVRVVGA